ncbi:mechanosensitive ion channel family protein [Crocosphaera sp.]|uniref:mechanosensitive ion channel family protein n=1 Tax=Crocosphaera sp. TaxID=2729996 RepID=UPI003F1EDF2F|nr:mechanosensitive ion channel family protein [Crocosphaera sp.]
MIKWLTIFSLSLTLTLTWIPISLGQIPLFTPPADPNPTQTPPWDLNQAYACGRFWCSNVYIYDDNRRIQRALLRIERALLSPELTLATFKELDQTNTEVAQILEQRARLVQQVFNKIVRRIIESRRTFDISYIPNWKFWIPTSLKDIWGSTTMKPLHPGTPKIEIGPKNQQTVIFIPDQFDLGIASQSIVTVTDVDARANGATVEELAKVWRETIIISLSNALWGHEFDRQYPLGRWIISVVVMFIGLILVWIIEKVRNYQKKCNDQLRKKLQDLTEDLTVDPEAKTSSKTEKYISEDANKSTPLDEKGLFNNNESEKDSKKKNTILLWVKKCFVFVKKRIKKNKWLYSKLHDSQQKLYLQQQGIIKQEINIYQLLLRIEFILQLVTVLFVLVIITFTFRHTRFFSVYLLTETLRLILVWIGLILVDKIGDFVIDYYLNRWAKQGQIKDPTSNRYPLRVNTYSIILKQATTVLFIILGIYLSIWIVGLNISILAGAGVFAIAIAFLSRSLLEDMLNGILILSTDRYAIGDVIDVGNGMAGFVEDINLFVTSLRNLDGQVIAIPNSKISTVINNTKNWSRVNFSIKIGWNEDIDKAIDIMIQVANQMQSEPEWGDKFLDPVEILGVDEVSNQGILIRLLIRTKPMEQWPIGREFRLRVKKAFDQAGISLGIPYQKIMVINSTNNDDPSSFYVTPEQDE